MKIRLFWVTLALALFGCGSGILLSSEPKFPRAEGSIDVVAGATGALTLTVSVRELPPPSEASPGANAYVVWLVPAAGGDPQRLGSLEFDTKLVGTLKTETAFHNFQIFVSPEESATPQTPLGAHLLTTLVSR